MFKFEYCLKINLLVLLRLLILLFSPPVSAIRKDVSLQDKYNCRTTIQGRFFLADDNGRVCDAFSVDLQSHCCPVKGDQFSCLGCNIVSQCCNSYEFCVSCCLNPAKTREELAVKVKMAKPSTAGIYRTVFDFCVGRCRHNSESVVHENAYLSEFHHCFSIPSNSSGSSSTQPEARLAGINVIIGRQGESCDSVCKYNGQSCVPNKLALLNQCEILQKYMSCKGSCLSSVGADQPAEVVDDAPKDLWERTYASTQILTFLVFAVGIWINLRSIKRAFGFKYRIQVLVCIVRHNLRFRVMVHIDIQGGFVLVHKRGFLSLARGND